MGSSIREFASCVECAYRGRSNSVKNSCGWSRLSIDQGGCWLVSPSLATAGRAVALSGFAGTRAATLARRFSVEISVLEVLELLTVRFHCDWFLICSRRGPGIVARIPRPVTRANGSARNPLHSFSWSLLNGSATLLPSRYRCNRGTRERCTHRNSGKEPSEDVFWLCGA